MLLTIARLAEQSPQQRTIQSKRPLVRRLRNTDWEWFWGRTEKCWDLSGILEVEPTFYNRFNVWHPGWWHLSVSSDLSDCVHEGTASWEGATLGVGAVAWIKESGFEYIKLEMPINHRSQGTANLFCKELEDKYFSFVGHVISVVTI